MNSHCSECPDKKACALLGEKNCPRLIGTEKYSKEIPFAALSTAIEIENLMQRSSSIYCGSMGHDVKREIRARAATMPGLRVKHIAAMVLLGSTDYNFTIGDIIDITGISERQIYYLKKRIK